MTEHAAAPPKKRGNSENLRTGRPKGAKNKISRDVRAMISDALSGAGGVDYLIERANDPKTASAFLALVGRVVPKEVVADVAVKATINWPVPAPKIET